MNAQADTADILRAIVDHCSAGDAPLYRTSPLVMLARQALNGQPKEEGPVASADAPETLETFSLRASAMPLAFRCAGSVRPPKVQIAETSEPAALGTAVHEALRPLAIGLGVQWGSLPEMAARYDVDADELRMLCAMATKLWKQIEDSFPSAETEVGLHAEGMSGHADVLSVVGHSARGADWKSGRKDADYSQQMRAYCSLVLQNYPEVDEVTFTLCWLRDGEAETYRMQRAELDAYLDEVHSKVIAWDGVYRPGPHCGHCRRSHECEARSALVRRDVTAFAERVEVSEALVPAEMLSLYRRAKMVKDAADRVQSLIRQHIEKNGDLVTPDGCLRLVEEPRRELDPAAAWPVLEQAGFTDEDFVSCMKLSISKVEQRVAQAAGRGNGAGAVRALNEKLESADAIKTKTTKRLEEKRT